MEKIVTVIHLTTTIHGKYLAGKILANQRQVKAIGEEKCGEQATISGYGIYTFRIYVNIGEESFGG